MSSTPLPPGSPPLGPPDVAEHRDLIAQWAAFVAGLSEAYVFDLDNWLNDVDIRQLIREASPMFSAAELGTHATTLREADQHFLLATRDVGKCLWGRRTARREKWTAAENWWYFRAPLRSNAELDEELMRVR